MARVKSQPFARQSLSGAREKPRSGILGREKSSEEHMEKAGMRRGDDERGGRSRDLRWLRRRWQSKAVGLWCEVEDAGTGPHPCRNQDGCTTLMLDPRGGQGSRSAVGAAPTRLRSWQSLFKPSLFPQSKELKVQPSWILSSASGKVGRAGFHPRSCKQQGYQAPKGTSRHQSELCLHGRSQGSLFLFIFFLIHWILPKRAHEGFTERRVGVQGGSLRPTWLNPCVSLLGITSHAGNTPWKPHSGFPIVVLYIITIPFFIHRPRLVSKIPPKTGISRHK